MEVPDLDLGDQQLGEVISLLMYTGSRCLEMPVASPPPPLDFLMDSNILYSFDPLNFNLPTLFILLSCMKNIDGLKDCVIYSNDFILLFMPFALAAKMVNLCLTLNLFL